MKGPGSNLPSEVPAKWRKHYKALLNLLDRLQLDHAEHQIALRTGEEKGGNDLVDHASFVHESQQLLDRCATDEIQQGEIEAALRRIESGAYGVCEVTGQRIEPQRLAALPWTRISSVVARQREALHP